MKNVLAMMSVVLVSACDVAYQVGAGPDAGGGGLVPMTAAGGSGGGGGGAGVGGQGDNTRSLAFACDLWDTGRPMSSLTGGPWNWFASALTTAWGKQERGEIDRVAERYLPLIQTTGDLECVTRDLLWDARARGTLGAFYKDWLKLDPAAPPQESPYTPVQWSEMVQDTLTFAIDTTASGVDNFHRLYTSPRPVALVPDADPSKVVAAATLQAGLLSDAAVLASSQTSDFPTGRGMWLMEKFACVVAPPPPPDVAPVVHPGSGGSYRQRLEAAVTPPACGACHALTDPPGYALAPLDRFGRLRDADLFGFRFDTKGSLASTTPALEFDDLNSFGAGLARTSDAASCYAARWNSFLFAQDANAMAAGQGSIAARAGELLLANRGDMRAAIAHVIVQGILP